jgi:hypothetical protein
MTFPVYVEDQPPSKPKLNATGIDEEITSDRVQKLEEEISAMRDTMSRFAELVLVELKRIKPPEPPPSPAPLTFSIGGMAPIPIAFSTPQALEASKRWLLPDLIRDISTTIKMYFDSRYRLRRATQLFVPVVLMLFVFNHFFWAAFSAIPLIPLIFEKIVDIVLAVLLYKVLYREMVRYREVIAQFNAATSQTESHSRVVHAGEEPHTQMDIEK